MRETTRKHIAPEQTAVETLTDAVTAVRSELSQLGSPSAHVLLDQIVEEAMRSARLRDKQRLANVRCRARKDT